MTKKRKTTADLSERVAALELNIKILISSCTNLSKSIEMLMTAHKKLVDDLFKPIK